MAHSRLRQLHLQNTWVSGCSKPWTLMSDKTCSTMARCCIVQSLMVQSHEVEDSSRERPRQMRIKVECRENRLEDCRAVLIGGEEGSPRT